MAAPLRAGADAAGLDAIVITPTLPHRDSPLPNRGHRNASAFLDGEDQLLQRIVEDVETRYRVRDKMLLSGYSGGGKVAHRFALQYPHLVKASAPCAPSTWTTPDGRLLVGQIGEIKNPVEYLSSQSNAEKYMSSNPTQIKRSQHLFGNPKLAVAYSRRAAPGAKDVPFLVMAGTLDGGFAMAQKFARSLKDAGFIVESEWPETPHGAVNDPRYKSEYERYTTRTLRFFTEVVSRKE